MSQSNKGLRNTIERYPLSNKPTLIITHKLQQQIDYLHKKVGNAEWSGELITKEIGKITDLQDWTVIAEDIWLADIGSPGFTGYQVDQGGFKAVDIVEMYEAFPGLLEGTHKNHHIHTHHNMGAFFSGTDESQLEDRGSQSNYFIMLVVDFKKTYKAKVAFKAEIKGNSEAAIHFANNADEFAPLPLNKEKDREVLVVMDMKIQFEEPESEIAEDFQKRFADVKAAIEEENKKKVVHFGGGGPGLGFRGQGYGKRWQQGELAGTDFSGSSYPSFNWDEEEKREKRKTRKKKGKKISEMTQAEFEAFERQSMANESGFELRHATLITNAIIDKNGIEPNYKPVPNRLYNLDFELRTESVKGDWAQAFVDSIPDYMQVIFSRSEPEHQVGLMNKLIELLTPYMSTELIRMIVTLLSEAVVVVSEEAMQAEADAEAEALVDSYSETSYSDETPISSRDGDLGEQLEKQFDDDEYFNQNPKLYY